jgi:hypothetical protein
LRYSVRSRPFHSYKWLSHNERRKKIPAKVCAFTIPSEPRRRLKKRLLSDGF